MNTDKINSGIKSFFNLLLYGSLVVLCIVIFDLKFDAIGVSFFLLALQLVFFISIYASHAVSLVLVYFIFSFIFFSIVPWLHYSSGILLWRTFPLRDQIYFELNFLIFTANSIVFIISRLNIKSSLPAHLKKNTISLSTRPACLFLLIISGVGFFTTLALNNFSISNLLFRGMVDSVRNNSFESSALQLFMSLSARMLTFFAFVYAFTQVKSAFLLKATLFILLLIAIFPTGVARFMVGMVYIPLMLIFFPRFRDGGLFSFLLIFSLIIFFPFLEQFRYFSGIENISLIPSIEFFYAAHFDAYENMATAIEVEFITYGRQLLGVLLFYVPRTYWETKPVGSGSEMANSIGYSFDNISMPFLGEGYVNLGFIGSVIFTVLLAYAMSIIDNRFTNKIRLVESVDFSTAFYFYLIGGLFFVMRGDLLSSTAFLSSGIFVAILLSHVMPIFKK